MRSDARSPIITVGACVLPERDFRHHRRVGHAQALDSAHAQLGIDDRHLVDAHAARPDLVVVGDRGATDVVVQLASRLDARPRVALLARPFARAG